MSGRRWECHTDAGNKILPIVWVVIVVDDEGAEWLANLVGVEVRQLPLKAKVKQAHGPVWVTRQIIDNIVGPVEFVHKERGVHYCFLDARVEEKLR